MQIAFVTRPRMYVFYGKFEDTNIQIMKVLIKFMVNGVYMNLLGYKRFMYVNGVHILLTIPKLCTCIWSSISVIGRSLSNQTLKFRSIK